MLQYFHVSSRYDTEGDKKRRRDYKIFSTGWRLPPLTGAGLLPSPHSISNVHDSSAELAKLFISHPC